MSFWMQLTHGLSHCDAKNRGTRRLRNAEIEYRFLLFGHLCERRQGAEAWAIVLNGITFIGVYVLFVKKVLLAHQKHVYDQGY